MKSVICFVCVPQLHGTIKPKGQLRNVAGCLMKIKMDGNLGQTWRLCSGREVCVCANL